MDYSEQHLMPMVEGDKTDGLNSIFAHPCGFSTELISKSKSGLGGCSQEVGSGLG